MHDKQVDKEHYRFAKYVHKGRWMSVWHQLDEVLSLRPDSVLEIGPGPGIFKAIASALGVSVETLDLDSELKPDHLGSVTAMSFGSQKFDVVCAFQVLEHLPFDEGLQAFREMARVAKGHIVVSLPDARATWRFWYYIPKIGEGYILVPKPSLGPKRHQFDGEHYWEINKAGYRLEKVVSAFQSVGKVALVKTYRVKEFPYHRFFIFTHRKR